MGYCSLALKRNPGTPLLFSMYIQNNRNDIWNIIDKSETGEPHQKNYKGYF